MSYAKTKLIGWGISPDDYDTIRRISMTLRRWWELECGVGDGDYSQHVERSEENGKCYMITETYYMGKPNTIKRIIRDRETGALKRLKELMSKYHDLRYYLQTDCRGDSLYIYREQDLEGRKIDQYYNAIGVPVGK